MTDKMINQQVKGDVTVDEFEAFIHLPENREKRFELINGEIVEVPSNPFVSMIAARILGELYIYLKLNDLGHLTGADGGFMVGGNRYAPDVAYIAYARQPELASEGYNPNPPDLAVEVISNPNNAEESDNLRLKLTSYLAAGVVVWVVNPRDQTVEVHEAGKGGRKLRITDTLTGGDILPGFELPVKAIFPPDPANDEMG